MEYTAQPIPAPTEPQKASGFIERVRAEGWPVGIVVILLWEGYAALTPIASLPCPTVMLGNQMYTGFLAGAYNLATAFIIGAGVYGIFNRKLWGKWVIIAYQLLAALMTSMHTFIFALQPEEVLSVYRQFFGTLPAETVDPLLSFITMMLPVFAWVQTLLIGGYLLYKKGWFEGK